MLQARRGTAYFARKLNELRDEDLIEASALPGWSRKHLVAHVGYNARALTRLLEWAATGVETPMYSSASARSEEIALGATLSPIALRNLFEHAAIHLNVEWRDLAPEHWARQVRTAQGRTVPVSETVWMRCREVWIHAVDLGNGARFADLPVPVLRRLRTEIPALWQSRGENVEVPEGTLADQVQWLSGRGGPLSAKGPLNTKGPLSAVRTAPRWL